jgi:hypothetical protein
VGAQREFDGTTLPISRPRLLARDNFWLARHPDLINFHLWALTIPFALTSFTKGFVDHVNQSRSEMSSRHTSVGDAVTRLGRVVDLSVISPRGH